MNGAHPRPATEADGTPKAPVMPSPIVSLEQALTGQRTAARLGSGNSLLTFLEIPTLSSTDATASSVEIDAPETRSEPDVKNRPARSPALIECLLNTRLFRLIRFRTKRKDGKNTGRHVWGLHIGVRVPEGFEWYEASLYDQASSLGDYTLANLPHLGRVPGLRDAISPSGILDSIREDRTKTVVLGRLVLALLEQYIWWCNREKLLEEGVGLDTIEALFLLGTEAHHLDGDTLHNVGPNLVGFPVLLHRLEHGLQFLPAYHRLTAFVALLQFIRTSWAKMKMDALYRHAVQLGDSGVKLDAIMTEVHDDQVSRTNDDTAIDEVNGVLTSSDTNSPMQVVTYASLRRFKGARMRVSSRGRWPRRRAQNGPAKRGRQLDRGPP